MKGQRVAHIAEVTCFENIVRIRRLIYPSLLFSPDVYLKRIVFPQSIVSLGEAMYQSCFLSLESRLNSELVNSVAKHKLKKKIVKLHVNFTSPINRGNKVF